jgi:hypothetical protein
LRCRVGQAPPSPHVRYEGALADFYGSPVGKSAMQKFGAYMADIMPVVQAEIVKAAAKMEH